VSVRNLDIVLVRHAETECSLWRVFCGDCDIPLTEKGARAATRLAATLNDGRYGPVDTLVSSSAVRAVQTARAIRADHSVDPRWAELRFGRWEGLRTDQVERTAEGDAWTRDPFATAPPGGESGAAVLARAVSALQSLADTYPNGRVAVVSHKHVIRLLLTYASDRPLRNYRAEMSVELGSVSMLRLDEEGLRLVSGARDG
jgi:alpha-ribazole phosphatase